MRLLEVNSVPYGSTGKIMFSIADLAQNKGMKALCFTGFSWHKSDNKNWRLIGSLPEKTFHMYMDRLTGLHGYFSYFSTLRFLRKVKKFSPDIIHIHNLHGWYINFPLFFKFIKKHNIPVVWTLHDCWSITGHCPHFTMIGCDRWKSGCFDCAQYKEYPKSILDTSKTMYRMKKKWFNGIENMTIVTPSKWLSEIIKQSYLRKYPVQIINNGIDLEVFKPTESDLRKRLGLSDTDKIILGVSLGWNNKKGLDVFIELAKRLDSHYKIILVGTDNSTDALLPESVISIHRTSNRKELAEIYSAADVFVNPTREDTFPTVNVESLACGTPVITFRTGGSPEIIDESSGYVVETDDIDEMEKRIISVCENKDLFFDSCLDRAKSYGKDDRFMEYYQLFRRIYDRTAETSI